MTTPTGPEPPSPATEAETRRALLDRSRRASAPVHACFVQNPDRKAPNRHGLLATLVQGRSHRALLALLLLLSIISNGDGPRGWTYSLSRRVWARALGFTESASLQSADAAVTRAFKTLDDLRLIKRHKQQGSRNVTVTLLYPDGSGENYTRPGKGNKDRFFKLPFAFWDEELDKKLSLPGLAMLLVCLHEKDGFELPTSRMSQWYGFSEDTAERGFKELRDRGIIEVEKAFKKAPLSPTGLTEINKYHLIWPKNENVQ